MRCMNCNGTKCEVCQDTDPVFDMELFIEFIHGPDDDQASHTYTESFMQSDFESMSDCIEHYMSKHNLTAFDRALFCKADKSCDTVYEL